VNTTTAETAARTELVGNVRDLQSATLAEIIRARRADADQDARGAASETSFNSAV